MRRDHAIQELKGSADAVRSRGATALYLFGSTVRDEADEASDVDVFIDYDPVRHFSLLDLVAIKHILEDRLGKSVDVLTRDGIDPLIKKRITREAIRVF